MDLDKAKQICRDLRDKYRNTSVDIERGEPSNELYRYVGRHRPPPNPNRERHFIAGATSKSSGLFRRDAVALVLNGEPSGFQICADTYLAQLCHALGGTIIIDVSLRRARDATMWNILGPSLLTLSRIRRNSRYQTICIP